MVVSFAGRVAVNACAAAGKNIRGGLCLELCCIAAMESTGPAKKNQIIVSNHVYKMKRWNF
jgi:hypothetical protein